MIFQWRSGKDVGPFRAEIELGDRGEDLAHRFGAELGLHGVLHVLLAAHEGQEAVLGNKELIRSNILGTI